MEMHPLMATYSIGILAMKVLSLHHLILTLLLTHSLSFRQLNLNLKEVSIVQLKDLNSSSLKWKK
jgi:hypothetical protein